MSTTVPSGMKPVPLEMKVTCQKPTNYFLRWDWPAAERECQRVLELNPNLADAHHLYAYLLGT